MTDSKIYLSPPHMTGNEQKYIKEAFDSNWIAPVGKNIDLFEQDIAQYVGAKGAVAVSSGTAAIHLALSILGVEKGDTVFCSSLTFVASANPILYQGADPVFIDSEPDTWNMSPQALERALLEAKKEGQLPKAIIVVHLYGQSAKMDEIMGLSEAYGVPVIEDAAESLGSTYKGRMTGTIGEYGVYSFNGNKIITTSSGGALVSDDMEALERVRYLATQARDPALHYQHSQMGFNYRMSNILAGIGRAQMEVIADRVKTRREIFNRYDEQLSFLPGLTFMPEFIETESNRWLTALTINEKEAGITSLDIAHEMVNQNIEVRPVWKPLHLQPLFRDKKYYSHQEGNSVSDDLYAQGICLPSGSSLTYENQWKVITFLTSLVERAEVKEGIV
ncbi:aminotransferase class I/II-fold pyridoxal phosphate-dependent enzyme [Halobacillus trueperi]|uniref:aminotransferase class I/II-fold pyridoxal phosphate-dependent enzyme n=1 Tax=Halobacillus trueperi TaxID=156205 RepID=UPI0037357021